MFNMRDRAKWDAWKAVEASFIILCILLLNYSVKSPFVSPVFSVFSYRDNSSLISWPFSFSSSTSNVKNGSFSFQESGDTNKIDELNVSRLDGNATFSNFSRKGTVLGEKVEISRNTSMRNFSEKVKNESFVVQELGITKKTCQLNGSQINGDIMTYPKFGGKGTALDIQDSTKNKEKYNMTTTYIEDVVGSSGDRKEVAVIEGKGGLSVEQNGVMFQSGGKSLIGSDKDFYGDCDILALSDVNGELQGWQEKNEKSNLLAERGSLSLQLKIIERRLEYLKSRFTGLEEKYSCLEKNKKATILEIHPDHPFAKCQKHIEAPKLTDKVITELENESLEQQVEAEFLLDEIERSRLGIYQVFKALDNESDFVSEDKVENEQICIIFWVISRN
ncbi:hypothetical protein HAX54_004221 [Datura stramonium]|uniref:Uncharacterized protein n=1 Tax=Datura stramonium TaxID=4076 RepID=A0ABS8WUT8_DATST|nr:hypothetical protein [Datura stramonium]